MLILNMSFHCGIATKVEKNNYSIYNQLLLNNLQVISQKYGRNL